MENTSPVSHSEAARYRAFLLREEDMLAKREAVGAEVRMDLKVCERCGALWCREIGREERYCKRCAGWLEKAERPSAMVLRVGRPGRTYKVNNCEGGVN